MTNAYKCLAGKPERKITLGKPKRRCINDIATDLKEIQNGVWSGFSLLKTESSDTLL